MTELIATGSTQADSADFTVVAGSPKSLYLKGTPPYHDAQFLLQHKDPSAAYTTVVQLDATNIASLGNITGAGTFRVRRLAVASGQQAGMDIEG